MSSTLSNILKMNPVAFVLLFVLSRCISTALFGSEPLPSKLVAILLSGTIFVVALFFEVWRVVREEESAEEAWKRRFGSGE